MPSVSAKESLTLSFPFCFSFFMLSTVNVINLACLWPKALYNHSQLLSLFLQICWTKLEALGGNIQPICWSCELLLSLLILRSLQLTFLRIRVLVVVQGLKHVCLRKGALLSCFYYVKSEYLFFFKKKKKAWGRETWDVRQCLLDLLHGTVWSNFIINLQLWKHVSLWTENSKELGLHHWEHGHFLLLLKTNTQVRNRN